jgi:hypothetical protein
LFPFSVIGATGWELLNWVEGYEAFWRGKATEAETIGDVKGAKLARNHAENAKLFGEHFQGITGQYQISYIESWVSARSTCLGDLPRGALAGSGWMRP